MKDKITEWLVIIYLVLGILLFTLLLAASVYRYIATVPT
jgi:hypothetical protein